MKFQGKTLAATCFAAAALAISATPADAQVKSSLKVRQVATGLNQPKGIDCADPTLPDGLMRNHLFVAESGADQVVVFATNGDRVAEYPVAASFPVGVACFGGSFAQDIYVGGAFTGSIRRLDVLGDDHSFNVTDMRFAGMDFGYGGDLFAGQWPTGNIWRIDAFGNGELFATIPGESRYVEYSPWTDHRARLFVTDFLTGAIYGVEPDGSVKLFAQTDAVCLEGLAFSKGGPFGNYLYAGDLCTGDIYRVDSGGNVSVWRGILPGAADICFTRNGLDQWVMYVVDGQTDGSLWAITASDTDRAPLARLDG